ncbi:hypothetical protein ATJ97_2493 [Georgenia soli]|uniref:Uncharacterized protein n=1 Tax=Georgenia soli TaxID=638953 RepID=A0A2A9EME2_9MICO|nr:hypothetical protein [Georgenia soli]PFG39973.1 hypothetical protein ATJ97_2493 [Georgenia soli]
MGHGTKQASMRQMLQSSPMTRMPGSHGSGAHLAKSSGRKAKMAKKMVKSHGPTAQAASSHGHGQMRPTVSGPHAMPALAIGGFATGARSIAVANMLAIAVGASALAFVAVWRLTVGKAEFRQLRIHELEVDDLTVRRLNVVERTSPATEQPGI